MIGITTIIFIFWVMVADAGNVKLTSECDNQISSSDRNLIDDAFNLLDSYKYALEPYINYALISGNPDGYTFIDPSEMSAWQSEVQKMGDGKIKIACKYSTPTNPALVDPTINYGAKCSMNPTMFGYTWGNDLLNALRDRVYICLDNLRNYQTNAAVLPASLSGVIAHELTHHVDGREDHGSDGKTNPINLDSDAETIGVAMEHLILTPDLSSHIKSATSTIIGGTKSLVISVRVKNHNYNADSNLQSIADIFRSKNTGEFRFRNGVSNLSVEIDGVTYGPLPVPQLDGSKSSIITATYYLPAYDPGTNGNTIIKARADASNQFVEQNEINNFDEDNISTAVDISVSAEVAAPPICHSMQLKANLKVPGYFSWLEIPYQAIVKNNESGTHAPAFDLVMQYENMWSSSSSIAQATEWVESLAPGESKVYAFTLDVPTDSTCSGPTGDTYVSFIADGNIPSLFDPDLSNNVYSLTVNSEYWKPDYAIRNIYLGITGPTQTLKYSVRNIGPATASSIVAVPVIHTKIVDEADNIVYTALTKDLEPGADQNYQVALATDPCQDTPYTLIADYNDAVDEYDERNNSTVVTISQQVLTFFGTSTDCIFGELQQVGEYGPYMPGTKFEGLNAEQWGTDGRAVDGITTTFPILDDLKPLP